METIEQLEHIIEELERKVNVALEKTTQLQRASEKALDTAMHVYKLDEYGYLWAYEAETQTYRKTKMRVATPEIINEAIKAKHIAEGAITGDKVEAGAVVPGKIADDAVQTRNIKDGNVTFDKLDEATKNIVITGGGQHGIPLSPEFGDSDVIGMTQRALTKSRDDLLDRIENVQAREQSDWKQTDEQAPTYIKNKPNIPPSAIVDPVPTRNSPNSVASGGVFDALQAQDAITAPFSADGKIYYDFKAGDIFYVEQDGVHKYRVAYVDGTADEEHPVTIDGLRFYFANNASDAIFKSILVKNVSTVQQQLTSTQKSTARENIAAVAYEKQELTSAQQVQLQNNMMGKEYAPANFSGLGKKVFAKNVQAVGGVDKNIMTQAFFEDEQGNPLTNTVFVIQYDYELGEDITIPDNCVLQFNGGSLSNGRILSNDLRIVTNTSGIFSNVTFGGSCIANCVCKLDWFIKQYPESDNDYSIDNTNEVKDCFASGFKNIKFPSKYIHLTDTITVHKVINILTEEGRTNNNWQHHPTDKKNSRPCIFSNTVVTLFDYQIDSQYDDADYGYTSSLYIGHIKRFIKKQFDNVADINVPVINITPITYLWGVTIDADITVVRRYFSIDGHTGWYFNYTGIKIATSQSTQYCSFVRINGNLVGLNCGVYLHGEPHNTDGWFTDVIIKGDTQCCYGGVFDNVTPITIYGNHQSYHLSHEQVDPEGYFTGAGIKLYGFVWDCGQTDDVGGLKTAILQVKLTGGVNSSFAVYPKQNIFDYDYYPNSYESILEPLNYYKMPIQNALYRALAPRNDNNWYIYPLTYTVDNVSILKNYPNLKNADNLFNDLSIVQMIPAYRAYKSEAYLNDVANKTIKLSFRVLHSDFNAPSSVGGLPNYMLWALIDTATTISIEIYNIVDGERVSYYNYNGTGNYYNGRLNVVRFPKNVESFYVDVTCVTTNYSMQLPTVIMPLYGHRDKVTISSNSVDKPNFNNQERYGVQCYDLQSKVLNIWDGYNWYNPLGIKASVPNFGTFANKPSSADIPVGFKYFCTDKQTVEGATNGIEIIHKGNDVWVDALGRVVS